MPIWVSVNQIWIPFFVDTNFPNQFNIIYCSIVCRLVYINFLLWPTFVLLSQLLPIASFFCQIFCLYNKTYFPVWFTFNVKFYAIFTQFIARIIYRAGFSYYIIIFQQLLKYIVHYYTIHGTYFFQLCAHLSKNRTVGGLARLITYHHGREYFS